MEWIPPTKSLPCEREGDRDSGGGIAALSYERTVPEIPEALPPFYMKRKNPQRRPTDCPLLFSCQEENYQL